MAFLNARRARVSGRFSSSARDARSWSCFDSTSSFLNFGWMRQSNSRSRPRSVSSARTLIDPPPEPMSIDPPVSSMSRAISGPVRMAVPSSRRMPIRAATPTLSTGSYSLTCATLAWATTTGSRWFSSRRSLSPLSRLTVLASLSANPPPVFVGASLANAVCGFDGAKPRAAFGATDSTIAGLPVTRYFLVTRLTSSAVTLSRSGR